MKILLAIDGSEHSAEAVKTVAGRPWPEGTEVRVLTSVETVAPPAAELWYDAGGSLERAAEEMRTRAEQLTAGVAESLRSGGLKAEAAVRDGEPRTAIVDEAKEWDADLIVLGSHGYTGLKRWLLGSVAQAVVSHAPCSVEVVRLKQTSES
jgi:nucleotide-binding universal stress UspA family protein